MPAANGQLKNPHLGKTHVRPPKKKTPRATPHVVRLTKRGKPLQQTRSMKRGWRNRRVCSFFLCASCSPYLASAAAWSTRQPKTNRNPSCRHPQTALSSAGSAEGPAPARGTVSHSSRESPCQRRESTDEAQLHCSRSPTRTRPHPATPSFFLKKNDLGRRDKSAPERRSAPLAASSAFDPANTSGIIRHVVQLIPVMCQRGVENTRKCCSHRHRATVTRGATNLSRASLRNQSSARETPPLPKPGSERSRVALLGTRPAVKVATNTIKYFSVKAHRHEKAPWTWVFQSTSLTCPRILSAICQVNSTLFPKVKNRGNNHLSARPRQGTTQQESGQIQLDPAGDGLDTSRTGPHCRDATGRAILLANELRFTPEGSPPPAARHGANQVLDNAPRKLPAPAGLLS